MSVVSTMLLQHDVKIHFFWKLVLRRYDVVSALLRMSNVEYSLLRDKISTAFPQSCKKKINNGMIIFWYGEATILCHKIQVIISLYSKRFKICF